MAEPSDISLILAVLSRREPIFHRPRFPTVMANDYWEIGASGSRYDRAFILKHLARNPPVDAEVAGWQTSNFDLRMLSADTFLLAYILKQPERVTRRATLWHRSPDSWEILYHQGTIVEPQTLE